MHTDIVYLNTSITVYQRVQMIHKLNSLNISYPHDSE